jgi:4-hydroxy-4-methyl-2-oxoglutarate aldolase
VKVGGQVVRTGDLLHGDQHGVLCVPEEIAPELPAAVQRVLEREQRILKHCQSPEFSLEELRRLLEAH